MLSTTTPFLAETTPAEVEPSLKPVVIILPANVTIDEIKTAIDLLPDTNNTAEDTNHWKIILLTCSWNFKLESSDQNWTTVSIDFFFFRSEFANLNKTFSNYTLRLYKP